MYHHHSWNHHLSQREQRWMLSLVYPSSNSSPIYKIYDQWISVSIEQNSFMFYILAFFRWKCIACFNKETDQLYKKRVTIKKIKTKNVMNLRASHETVGCGSLWIMKWISWTSQGSRLRRCSVSTTVPLYLRYQFILFIGVLPPVDFSRSHVCRAPAQYLRQRNVSDWFSE